MKGLKFKHTITNNFNNDIIYTSVTGKRDLQNDVRSEARKYGKEITDFKITKI